MSSVLPGELAWYVTGRFYAQASKALADYGYFLHLGTIAAPLFDGEPGEATAHFTFAAQPFEARSISNGALSLALDPVGSFAVYFQAEPRGNFDDPASFALGQCIARFRRSSVVVGTTVNSSAAAAAQALVASNVFSARLIDSEPFQFRGRHYDLREMLGQGVTQFGTAATAPVEPALENYTAVIPFSGSALALGPG
ncbi:hypothetical protein DFR29_114101 [Tahibacter aquaticus]|uniref:Uncharacterized protein n=1 Tax=Tahibacter aquaticus TaxID=520092 RepID=A0A4R6YQ82_9GAMM|nr:hypothetical protein [Tahibacter aquaticus]TDR40049.1 hypothetical protein DFR29_114101 [Tahibacter aquaticus]